MAINSISRAEFNRMFTFDSELAPYIGDEVEWYADDAKNVIGVIARGVARSEFWGVIARDPAFAKEGVVWEKGDSAHLAARIVWVISNARAKR